MAEAKAFEDMPTAHRVPRLSRLPDLQGITIYERPLLQQSQEWLNGFLEGCMQNPRLLSIFFLIMAIGAGYFLYTDPEMNAWILRTAQDMVEQMKPKLLDMVEQVKSAILDIFDKLIYDVPVKIKEPFMDFYQRQSEE